LGSQGVRGLSREGSSKALNLSEQCGFARGKEAL